MGDLRCGDKGDEESGRGVGVSIETCAASESVCVARYDKVKRSVFQNGSIAEVPAT